MSILKSSVAKKITMALSGLFLIVFIFVHLAINIALIYPGKEAFDAAVEFMGTNPIIQIMQPILFLGFIVHISMAIYLELGNRANRPVNYAKLNAGAAASWASRNMIWTGLGVLVFLLLHFYNYFIPFKTEEIADHYALVISLFKNPIFTAIYIFAFVSLGIHLSHGFQSAFQSLGVPREEFNKPLVVMGNIVALIVAFGFSAIAIYFYFN
jgi:succinate dehydrogenase / fumarate reductase cytochrome b subunit